MARVADAERVTVRPATPTDVSAITRIYNHGIRERVATFETRERTDDEVAEWLSSPLPLLVAVSGSQVVGWARVSAYSSRPAYDGVGEHAVYVDPAARGSGVARLLLRALALAAEDAGLHKLSSRIFADNAPSLATHRAAGFAEVGTHRRHAKLDGRWKDCVVVEQLLRPALGD